MAVKYFAYGSNMAELVMEQKCPGHRFLGVARLPDHRLMFTRRSVRTGTGVADVVPVQGESVWGTLYEIDDDELATLDRKEGNGWAYVREPLDVELVGDGSPQEALAYTVKEKEPTEVPPSREYLDGMIAAASERGLPAGYVEALKERREGAVAASDGR
jgi:gamma-glutamylcyclotransferase